MITGVCEICGNEFTYSKSPRGGRNRKMCDTCKNDGDIKRQYYAKNCPRPRSRKSKIDKIQKQARKAGLTYGQYQAKKYMEETKVAEIKV